MRMGELYKDEYYIGTMQESTADIILDLVSKNKGIRRLKHCIYDIPLSKIDEIKSKYKKFEKEYGNVENMEDAWGEYEKPIGELRPYQTIGVAFLFYAGSALLGDEVGLGKTVQIAGLVNLYRESYKNQGREKFNYVFITEKTSVPQIRDKMIQFTGEYVGVIETGGQKDVNNFIELNKNGINYSIVAPHSILKNEAFMVYCKENNFDLCVVDESSVLKSRTSQLFKSTELFRNLVNNMIMLNATPIEEGAKDLYNQFKIIDKMFMPSVTQFERTYCKMVPRFGGRMGYEIGGYKNTDFFRKAITLRYLARTREILGARNEDNKSKTYIIPLTKVQKELIKKTTMYQMVADYPTGVNPHVIYDVSTCSKLRCLIDVVTSLNIKKDKALIYCRWKECQEEMKMILEDMGYWVTILNGSTKMAQRDTNVKEFNAGRYDIIITNVQRGLDIDSCNNCILYTIDPNPQKMIQFEGRITRAFDVIGKNVYLLVADGHEKRNLEQRLKMRIDTSNKMLVCGRSMVNNEIMKHDNREIYEVYDFDEDEE